MNSRRKKFFTINHIAYFVFLGIFTLLVAEIILRIYNPIAPRTKGDKIILPVNRVYSVIGGQHTKNSLGFRGPEKPEPFETYLSIITVGGSTTECANLPDEVTWSAKLDEKLRTELPNVWLNNAGLDGHSTFGHRILLQDYLVKLKPKAIIFLVGINDVGREDLKDHDRNNILDDAPTWRDWLARKSEVANLILAYKRTRDATNAGLTYRKMDFNRAAQLTLSDESIKTELAKHGEMTKAYKNRLVELVTISKQAGIKPVLVTQPSLVGIGVDPISGVNLETIQLDKEMNKETNGKLFWLTLELYNQQTRNLAIEAGIKTVDLAALMPRSSLYFYDSIHFTAAGSEKVAEILYGELIGEFKQMNLQTDPRPGQQ